MSFVIAGQVMFSMYSFCDVMRAEARSDSIRLDLFDCALSNKARISIISLFIVVTWHGLGLMTAARRIYDSPLMTAT